MFGFGAKIRVAYPLSLWLVQNMRQPRPRPKIEYDRLTVRCSLSLADHVYGGLLVCCQHRGGLKLRKPFALLRNDSGSFHQITRWGGWTTPFAWDHRRR